MPRPNFIPLYTLNGKVCCPSYLKDSTHKTLPKVLQTLFPVPMQSSVGEGNKEKDSSAEVLTTEGIRSKSPPAPAVAISVTEAASVPAVTSTTTTSPAEKEEMADWEVIEKTISPSGVGDSDLFEEAKLVENHFDKKGNVV